ncbi:hypothetical protein [Streptomyces sp. AA1529]|uniref:hypothetical protein n=1 Tax=Streptomyces sp. AA1529 TaxID=1203257 RepID=UPI003D719CD3
MAEHGPPSVSVVLWAVCQMWASVVRRSLPSDGGHGPVKGVGLGFIEDSGIPAGEDEPC